MGCPHKRRTITRDCGKGRGSIVAIPKKQTAVSDLTSGLSSLACLSQETVSASHAERASGTYSLTHSQRSNGHALRFWLFKYSTADIVGQRASKKTILRNIYIKGQIQK